ncbi:DUF167 domain-containing protein [Kribbella speibonae]|uniref:UPF0235 protein E0H92_36870 n=1 Tax=Kribbella speibonae TaxID=1572660 RepID=A0A4R0IFA4_9ACTN|nr:DUF167 family protein [Kribbella speibonae]TCC30700.1 DUF167 domain-containing protein [Kribbella speibonae]
MRVLLRVRPGASRTAVGGQYGGPGGPALVVAVAARAVEGQATQAALRAVAAAFGVRPSAVTLVHGATSRDKLVDVQGDESKIRSKLEELLS